MSCDNAIAATVFCVLLTLLAIGEFIVIGVLVARLRGIKVEVEIQAFGHFMWNWITNVIATAREYRTNRRNVQSVEIESNYQNTGNIHTINHPGSDTVVTDNPIQKMANVMNSSVNEQQTVQPIRDRNTQHQMTTDETDASNKTKKSSPPSTTEKPKIVFTAYDIATYDQDEHYEPLEYEVPLQLHTKPENDSNQLQNVIFSTYDVATRDLVDTQHTSDRSPLSNASTKPVNEDGYDIPIHINTPPLRAPIKH